MGVLGAVLVLGVGQEVQHGQGQGQDLVWFLELRQGREGRGYPLMGTAGLIHRIEQRQGEACAWRLLVSLQAGQLQQRHQLLQSQLHWL